RASGGAGRVLRVVQAAQRANTAEPRDFTARGAGGTHNCFALDIDAVRQRVFDGDPPHAFPRRVEPIGDVAAEDVVDTDDRGARWLHAGDQTLLHRGVVLQRAVAVDVILADVEQDADGRIE